MEDNKPKDKQEFVIEVPADMQEGQYVNMAMIAHSMSEFVLDFAKTIPAQPKAKIKSRVVMTPIQAKRLLHMLQENIARYEQNFGEIQQPSQQSNPTPFPSFGGGGEA